MGAGHTVRLMRVPTEQGSAIVSFDGVRRLTPLWQLAGPLVIVVAMPGRWRGLLALVGLGFSGVVMLKFMLPALLSGSSGLGVALAGQRDLAWCLCRRWSGRPVAVPTTAQAVATCRPGVQPETPLAATTSCRMFIRRWR